MNTSDTKSRALYQQALDAYQRRGLGSALEHLDQCIAESGGNADLHNALLLKGMISLDLQRNAEARQCFERAVEISPSVTSHYALSVSLARLEHFDLAAAQARKGLALPHEQRQPLETANLLHCLGDALRQDKRFEEAAQAYRQALDLFPNNRDAHLSLGFLLLSQDQLEAAIEHFRQTLAIDPDYLPGHSNLAYALLATGSFEEAWPHFEHRWVSFVDSAGKGLSSRPALPIRRWEGEFTARNDQRLLVLAEQGLGDTLQFCRYLPRVLTRFQTVGFVCPKPLRRLLDQSFRSRWPNLILLDKVPASVWEWDGYIPLMSMPKAFGTDLHTIPADIPYLHVEPGAVRKFSSRLDKLAGASSPRIGLVWAGGHGGLGVDQWRSIAPEQLDPLFAWPHAQWVSLQKPESTTKRLGPDQHARVVDWMNEIDDFAATAGLVASLDLVISVDTSVAHLAAAMGKPVWLLNRFAGCWRWLRGRDDSPWYPSMRIFTQKKPGDWKEVLQRVLIELERARHELTIG
ncbi:tetratricopeptide repeat protein [Caballeronia catudaia]|uniref:tetratricopeptide repeat protein n=1 Tax=Caballeronia catudaia TaxID=1777136 RepID=UPI00077271CA|nr:tetratricopeptide repeat protein [Caballeronia catudaia]